MVDYGALAILGGVLAVQTITFQHLLPKLPKRVGQVRRSRRQFMGPSYAVTTGLFMIGYGIFLQEVRRDDTSFVPIVFAAFYLIPSLLIVWRRARWRLVLEAGGIREARWPFDWRFMPWDRITVVSVEARSGQVALRTTAETLRFSVACEGVDDLLDAAMARSIPITGVRRDPDVGWIVDKST